MEQEQEVKQIEQGLILEQVLGLLLVLVSQPLGRVVLEEYLYI